MLQRIQTVYLLISMILMGLLIFIPSMTIDTTTAAYQLKFQGLMEIAEGGNKLVETTIFLSILTAIIPLISLITINLYKRRILQIRLSIFNILLMIGYYALFALTCYTMCNQFVDNGNNGSMAITLPVVFPFISAILTYLAVRAIGKDEVLVKAADRLR
ncbi:MAG: DUF4293 domain-containing protein [bacterium]